MLRQLYNNWICYQDGIQAKKRMNMLTKELFRKAIHICAAFVPLFLDFAYYPVMVLLTLVLVLYCVAEYLRCKGHTVPVISFVTMVAARKRDENRFVLGPATLAMGVLLTAAFFQPLPARVGIVPWPLGMDLPALWESVLDKYEYLLLAERLWLGVWLALLQFFVPPITLLEVPVSLLAVVLWEWALSFCPSKIWITL